MIPSLQAMKTRDREGVSNHASIQRAYRDCRCRRVRLWASPPHDGDAAARTGLAACAGRQRIAQRGDRRRLLQLADDGYADGDAVRIFTAISALQRQHLYWGLFV